MVNYDKMRQIMSICLVISVAAAALSLAFLFTTISRLGEINEDLIQITQSQQNELNSQYPIVSSAYQTLVSANDDGAVMRRAMIGGVSIREAQVAQMESLSPMITTAVARLPHGFAEREKAREWKTLFNGLEYRLITEPMLQNVAETRCFELFGHLASDGMSSMTTRRIVKAAFQLRENPWIGLRRLQYGWAARDGSSRRVAWFWTGRYPGLASFSSILPHPNSRSAFARDYEADPTDQAPALCSIMEAASLYTITSICGEARPALCERTVSV